MHKSEISDLLKLMSQKKLLVAEGSGRGTKYYLPQESMNVLRNSASLDANSASSDTNSASLDANSASLDTNSASNKRKRLSKEELKSLIISICNDWVTIEEIVEKTGKSTSYIRNVVIPLLVAEKTIVMMFPGTPRSPKQKYRIKE